MRIVKIVVMASCKVHSDKMERLKRMWKNQALRSQIVVVVCGRVIGREKD
jgi:hypothetical protein